MRKHKTALVTGASSGLGREFSLILAQKKIRYRSGGAERKQAEQLEE